MGKVELIISLFFVLFLAGCGKEPIMDQPAQDGKFYYRNKDLGFNLVLPPEFLYYQTQRKETPDYIDLEFFVPTNDTGYPQEVPSYAKPAVVRIFDKDDWERIGGEGIFQKLGEKKGWFSGGEKKVYSIKFWDEPPVDWLDRWSEKIEQEIIGGFSTR
ncbi:MAG: hypothetical protein PHQ42_03450 [Patescibacteria group bacterium]|nr:hypothetical protein [Patescibacteria group bacterium]